MFLLIELWGLNEIINVNYLALFLADGQNEIISSHYYFCLFIVVFLSCLLGFLGLYCNVPSYIVKSLKAMSWYFMLYTVDFQIIIIGYYRWLLVREHIDLVFSSNSHITSMSRATFIFDNWTQGRDFLFASMILFQEECLPPKTYL